MVLTHCRLGSVVAGRLHFVTSPSLTVGTLTRHQIATRLSRPGMQTGLTLQLSNRDTRCSRRCNVRRCLLHPTPESGSARDREKIDRGSSSRLCLHKLGGLLPSFHAKGC